MALEFLHAYKSLSARYFISIEIILVTDVQHYYSFCTYTESLVFLYSFYILKSLYKNFVYYVKTVYIAETVEVAKSTSKLCDP